MAMARQMKVGLFVLLGLGLLAFAIFIIGQNRRFWEPKITYRAAFKDVSGLKPGAPVRTGGLDIGAVISVGHADTTTDTRIYVTLAVSKSEAARIRQDTVARVVPKGLLGDKMVEFSVADGSKPPQDPNVLLVTKEPEDMFAAIDQLTGRVKSVIEHIDPLAQALGDPKFSDDIKGSAESTHKILDGLANQDSVAHRMLFDANDAQRFSTTLNNFAAASNQLNGLLADMHDVSSRAKDGPGLVHALVYDGDIAANAAGTVSELHQDMLAVRQGNGLAHNLLYGDDSGQHMMGNLNKMSDDLREIVASMKAGKGTIGALLVDPTIYEDLKSAVGNVERNEVLRALVRYSIKADEAKPHVDTAPVRAASP